MARLPAAALEVEVAVALTALISAALGLATLGALGALG
jgi:hypothetical protein